jgi:hypothetical protein
VEASDLGESRVDLEVDAVDAAGVVGREEGAPTEAARSAITWQSFPTVTIPAAVSPWSICGALAPGVDALVNQLSPSDPDLVAERIWLIIEGLYSAAAHPGGTRSVDAAVSFVN